METKKRLKILDRIIKEKIDPRIFEGILLTGSMSFGKNYSVTKDSDIDLLFVIKKENITKIIKSKFFVKSEHFAIERIELLKAGKTDGLWIDQFIDGIMINMGIVSAESFKKICGLRNKYWKISTQLREYNKRNKLKTINGNFCKDSVKITKNKEEWNIRKHTIKNNDDILSQPIFSNILSGEVIYDKDGQIQKESERLKKLLLKRYGYRKVLNLLGYVLKKMSKESKLVFCNNLKY
ncbi:MAG TPA: hypothetical protein DIT25_03505 [Candidatus Moranbacteria bacterium]|nr:hypothetical protein [Candidatus Moranbacteria bacterium]